MSWSEQLLKTPSPSTSTLKKATRRGSLAAAICSKSGAMARQGPHHAAVNWSTASGEGDDAEEEDEEEGEGDAEELDDDTLVAAIAASKASSEESSVTLPPVAEELAAEASLLDEKVRNEGGAVKGEREGLLAAKEAAAARGRRLRSRTAEEEMIDADCLEEKDEH